MLPDTRTRRRRVISLTALVALLAPAAALATTVAPAVAAPAPTTASTPSGPCPDEDGITVVVDLTDLDGEVAVGCAPGDPGTGTDALRAAGFTETRDAAGMICAIADLPNPCPAEFQGQFWSYWSAEPGGEWTTYSVGSDQSDPAPGSVEGWRYSDGSAGPTIEAPSPGDASASGDAADDAAADSDDPDASTDASTDVSTAPAENSGSAAPLLVALAAVALVGAAGFVAARRRRDGNGPPGQH